MSADKDKKRGEGGCSSCLLEEAFQDTEKKNQRIENGIVLQQSKTISVYTQGFFLPLGFISFPSPQLIHNGNNMSVWLVTHTTAGLFRLGIFLF
jgi:hypothetical protein